MCISGINTHPLVLSCFRWRGVGVKVLGPVAASELAPMSVARLLGYSLMDVKRTYLLTGMNEEALGIIRCAETHTAVHVCVCVCGGGAPSAGDVRTCCTTLTHIFNTHNYTQVHACAGALLSR